MHVRGATFAYWDQATNVFSLPCGFLTEPDRPLIADIQISSSILVQEARRRHRALSRFPPRSYNREISSPQQPGKAVELEVVPMEPLAICHHCQSCQLATEEAAADVSAKQSPVFILLSSTEYPSWDACFFYGFTGRVIIQVTYDASPFLWLRCVCDDKQTHEGAFDLYIVCTQGRAISWVALYKQT